MVSGLVSRRAGISRYDGIMRGVARVSVLVVTGAACTVSNPAYQSSEGDDAVATDDGETATATSTGSASTDGGQSTGEPLCEPHPSRPFDIQVSTHEPDCTPGSEILWLDLGSNLYPPSRERFDHELCEPPMCDCPAKAPLVSIQMASDAVLAEDVRLPDCGPIALWARNIDDSCQWAGLVMWDGNEILPSVIVSRTLDVPPFATLGDSFALELVGHEGLCVDLEPCPDSRRPGQYAIGVLDQHTVTVEQSPKLLEIQFGAAGSRTYLFDNRMSSINRECRLQLAWSAQLWQ